MAFDGVDEIALEIFSKAFVGEVMETGMTYNIQDVFDLEGHFGVKVTPLGERLCLLENRGGRVLQNLLDSGAFWLSRWFVEVKKWEPCVVDEEHVTWVRLFGLPCHV